MATAAKVAYAKVSSQNQSIDRLILNIKNLLEVTKSFQKKGVVVYFLRKDISLDRTGDQSSIEMLLLSMKGAVTEFERSLIRKRQAEVIAITKTRGVYKGRAPISSELFLKPIRRLQWGFPIPVLPRISKLDTRQSTNT